MEDIKVIDFTGFEREFEFVAKVDGKFEEFKAYAEPKYKYDKYSDAIELIILNVKCSMYHDDLEKHVPCSLDKDELELLRQAMSDAVDWDDIQDWVLNFHNHN